MKKYHVMINHVLYEFDKKDTVYNICKSININIPTLYLGNNDISKVEINTSPYLQDPKKIMIEDFLVVNTNSIKVRRNIRKVIYNLHNSLDVSCDNCKVLNCNLKAYFKKYYLLLNKTSDFKLCNYYKQGIKADILIEEEHHFNLESILNDKSVHKVAVVDDALASKISEIYKKGFNEVITQSFFKKLKMAEELASCLKIIASSLDNEENMLPCVILENKKDVNILPTNLINKVVYKADIYDIADKVFDKVIDNSKVKVIYITTSDYLDSNRIMVTYDYLMNLKDINNLKYDNITKILKLDNKYINYNSFVNYFIDVLKSKDLLSKDIYQEESINVHVKNKTFKIQNFRNSNTIDGDIILVLNQAKEPITESFIKDNDINNIYKNYLKEPGKLI